MFNKLLSTLRNLPVAGIATDVASSVLGGTVTVVASATGSGKTLTLPPSLAYASDHPVVVLVPRRFLAVNAAETVAELANVELGTEVGYAVGAQSGEKSVRSADTKVLYCTYGYAIASDLILTAGTIVFDEVHEASLDMSICRALVYRRLQNGEKVNVLEMSATINAQAQAAYWGKIAEAKVYEIDGKTFDCKRLHRAATQPHDAVMELIDMGRKGILVFRPGVGEVHETADAVRRLAEERGLNVEVAEIYGELDYAARKAAVSTPKKGGIKVLVGTNVVESGANIPWLDAGVSCGTGKELSVRAASGATFLCLVELPRWRLEQQEGRVKRFTNGIFVLCAQKAWDGRPAETTPEIKRLPLTELVLHCADFKIRAEELTFDHAPEKARIVEAETKLQRLGLIDKECRLTNAGRFVAGMPVGPETGAMLWHAKQTQCLGAALPLAAVMEVGGVRKDFRKPHLCDSTSDWLDGLKAFQMALDNRGAERKELMENYNIGYKRFEAARELLADIRRRFNGDASRTMVANDDQLRRCIIAGHVTDIFTGSHFMRPVKNRYTSYEVGRGSAVSLRGGFAVGQLRTIQPKNRRHSPFTVLEKVTNVSLEDVLAVANVRKDVLERTEVRERIGYFRFQLVITYKLFGAYDLHIEKLESPLTDDEVAEKASFEAVRDPLKARLESLNQVREQLAMGTIRCGNGRWQIGSYGSVREYIEELVVEIEERMKAIVLECHAKISELSEAREEVELAAAIYTDDGFKFGSYGRTYAYTADGLAQAEQDNIAAIAEKREAAAKLLRDAEEGKVRLTEVNRRRAALDLDRIEVGEKDFVSGYYRYPLHDLDRIATKEEEVAQMEAQQERREQVEAERRAAEAKRQEAMSSRLNDLAAHFNG